MKNLNRTPQLRVTMTPAMCYALEVLSERSGLPPATEARRLLNAALKQTMNTQEVKDRINRSPHEPDRWHFSSTPRYRRDGHGTDATGPEIDQDGT
jgi:hypothetical protein